MRISDWSSDVCSSDLLEHCLFGALRQGGRVAELGEAAGIGHGCSSAVICRITLAGLPATTQFAGTSFVTTLPAPTTAPSPTLTPGSSTAAPPTQTLRPRMTGLAVSMKEIGRGHV